MAAEDDALVRMTGRYEFMDKVQEYTTCFYSDRLAVFCRDRRAGEVLYTDIQRVSRNREGVCLYLDGGSSLKIPCGSGERRAVFRLFRLKRLGLACLNAKSIVGLAAVEFADLLFLVPLDSISFDEFKKKAIKRIGRHFFPAQNVDFVSLDHYDELSFYVRRGEALVVLDGDDDLASALLYFDKRLDVLIRHVARE